MLRARSGASILHCDRGALRAAALPFTTVQKRRISYTVGDAQPKFVRMESTSKKRTPSIVNLTVKRRYLTEHEVERLIDCARKYGRYGHRDATMILVAFRQAGLGAGGGGCRRPACRGRRRRGTHSRARRPRYTTPPLRRSWPGGRRA